MPKKIIAPILSLNAKVEQLAKLLRITSKRNLKKSLHSTRTIHTISSSNAIQQIAKRLRREALLLKKKRKDVA